VNQSLGLFRDCTDDLGMTVADIHDSQARIEVYVLVSVDILDDASGPRFCDKWIQSDQGL
jgi:hypothetical protein